MNDRELLDKASESIEKGNHEASMAYSMLLIARNLAWLTDNADRLTGRG